MLRPDDPYNQGIGTLDLGDMNLGNMNVGNVGQVPVNNMQVAEAINYGVLPGATEAFTPEWQSGATSNLGVKEWMEHNPNPTRGDFIDAIQSGTFGSATPGAFKENVGSLFEGVNLDQRWNPLDATPSLIGTNDGTWRQSIDINKDALEQEALDAFPEGFWKDDDQTSLDADFYNEYGYPKTAMINPLSIIGMVKAGLSKKEIAKALIKNKLQKEIGKKVKPVLTGILTDGKAAAAAPTSHAEARSTGGDYHSGHESTVGGQTTDWGSESAMIARGGLAQYAPRGSYFDGGLASLWLR